MINKCFISNVYKPFKKLDYAKNKRIVEMDFLSLENTFVRLTNKI